MNYYYLNDQHQVQGPFTADTMRQLMQVGIINGATLATTEGNSTWGLLETLNLNADMPPAGNGFATVGQCPFCMKQLEGAQVPHTCPHCKAKLHPEHLSMWGSFWFTFKKFLSLSGRATRREYWSFSLFSLFSHLACFAIMARSKVDFACVAYISIPLTLAWIGVTVRRLHDTGRSGYALWLCIGFLISFLHFMIFLIYLNLPRLLGLELGLEPAAGHEPSPLESLLSISTFFSLIAGIACGTYTLGCMFLPSQRGENKYGPSVRYPHG